MKELLGHESLTTTEIYTHITTEKLIDEVKKRHPLTQQYENKLKAMKKIKLHISDEPHCRELESLGSIFVPLVRGLMSAEDFVEADIMLNWADIAGEELRHLFTAESALNPRTVSVLFVEVPAGGFALEMQHREGYILEKINAYFGYKAVHRLNVSQNIKMRPRVLFGKKLSRK